MEQIQKSESSGKGSRQRRDKEAWGEPELNERKDSDNV